MKDLQVIFNAGLIIALFSIGGWLAILLLISLLRLVFKAIVGFIRINEVLTHENPYIVKHQKLLIEQKQYEDYLKQAKKDGIIIDKE